MPSAQTVHIPAGLPIDEVTREELLDAGRANQSNVNVRQTERLSLEKRLGFAPMTRSRLGAVTRSNGLKLFQHNGVPMVIHRPSANNQLFVDSYSESLGLSVQQSSVPECSYRLIDLMAPGRSFVATDTAYANGFIATATITPAFVIVTDSRTNTTVLVQTFGAASGATMATFADRYIVLFVRDASTTEITARILDTENIAASWIVLATVAATSEVKIPCSCSLDDRVAIAYGVDSGTDRVVVKTYDESGLLETRTIATASGTPNHIDIDGSIAGTLWVVWDVLGATQLIGIDADSLANTLASAVSPLGTESTHALYVCEGPAGTARVVDAQYDGTISTTRVAVISTSAGAAVVNSTREVYHVGVMSRPWQRGGRFFIAACGGAQDPELGTTPYRANVQRTCIVVEFGDAGPWWVPFANIEPGLVSLASTSKVVAIDSTRYVFPVQVVKSGSQTFASILAGDSTAGNMLVELDFGSRARWQTADFANYTYLGGALTSVFDGRTVVEAGFLVRPTKLGVGGAGGSGDFSGTYRYVAVYEDVDAAGNWTVSSISEPSDAVSVTDDTHITVVARPLTISRRDVVSSVRIALYRTGDGGLPPYYRLTTIDNDTTDYELFFVDDIEDTELFSHAKLYAPNLPGTVGESLDRRAPPGLVHLTSYNGMLVGARGESFFWSGQEVYGEAPWFSPPFEVPVTGGGDITALASQDGTLLIFKTDRVFAVSGEAPSDNGLQGGFGVPRLLASDVGCVDANSVVVTSLGIFFRSARGYELLNRSQQVEPLGEPVGVTVGSYPVTTAAVLDERNSLVRVSLSEGESDGAVTGEGVDVVFDLTIRAWISTDFKRGSTANEAAQSATVVHFDGERRYAWLGTDGTVYTERDYGDSSECLDGTSWVEAQYELAPLKIGLQQEQRVYEMELLFERHSASGLEIEAANDYGDYASVTADKVWTETAIAGKRQVSFRPKPRGMAVQLRIRDTAPETLGTGRGLTFIGVSADIAAEQRFSRGTMRLAPGVRR